MGCGVVLIVCIALLVGWAALQPFLKRASFVEQWNDGWLARIVDAIGEPTLRLRSPGALGDRVQVEMPGGPEAFSLVCLRTEEQSARWEGSRQVPPTPDPQIHPFETCFAIKGDLDLAHAVLDPALKQALVSMAIDWRYGPVSYAVGTLRSTIQGTPNAAPQIEGCARQLVEAAHRLREAATPEALLELALRGSDEDRRRAARTWLLNQMPSADRDQVVDALEGSSDPLERLVWTLERGDEALLSAELDRQIDLARAPAIAQALERLHFTNLPAPRRRLLGLRLLSAGGVVLRARGLELVRSSCGPGDAEAERALLGLSDPGSTDERLTLIQALGQVASVAAVPRLQALARRGSGETTRRAREAIQEIQARAVGAEAGAVRLSPELPQEGAIRVTDQPDAGADHLAREHRAKARQRAPLLSRLFSRRDESRWNRGWLSPIAAAVGDPGLKLGPYGQFDDGVNVIVEGCPEGFSIRCLRTEESLVALQTRDREALLTGDHVFESFFSLQGDPLLAEAVLGPELRAALLAMVLDWRFGTVNLDGGALSTTVKGGRSSAPQVEACVRQLADLARRIREAAEPGALIQLAVQGTDGARRQAALVFLLESPPGAPRGALLDALERHPGPVERLIWALERGDDPTLEATLDQTVTPEHAETLSGPLEQLRLSQVPPARRRLLGLRLLGVDDGTLRRRGVELLTDTCAPGDLEAERALLAIGVPNHLELQFPLAVALGRLASIAAVPRLRELIEQHSRDLTRQARASIREIQARTVGAEAGAFRLSPELAEEGAIRVVDEAERGAVRLARERQGS